MAKKKVTMDTSGEIDFDMTPMIDVVFQLIIFFMVALSFAKQEVQAKVELPVASAAVPPERAEEELFVLNVVNVYERNPDTNAYVNHVPGNPGVADALRPYVVRGQKVTEQQLTTILEEQALASKYRSNTDEITAAVIIRGDRETSWREIFKAMLICRNAGFIKVYLKALTKPVNP